MYTFDSSKFQTRQDLENEIRRVYGLTADKKDAEIVGTVADLKRLNLSERTIVWGVSCRATDKKAEQVEISEKPARGEIHPHGLDGKLKRK